MKKFALILFAAIASVFVKKKIDSGRNEQALWAEATDSVDKAGTQA